MPLELDRLRNAIASLSQALRLSRYLAENEGVALEGDLDSSLRVVVRSGVIKHFEFTYDLSWQFMKRWLELNVNPHAGDGVTRRELYRLGFENRLIDDVDRWMRYHGARNLTSHTYREATADEVYAVLPDFLEAARLLLAALETRDD